jgi:hypothetical protein
MAMGHYSNIGGTNNTTVEAGAPGLRALKPEKKKLAEIKLILEKKTARPNI